MYVNAQGAMSRRSALANPTGAIQVLQHPGLTRLGRLTGSSLVTMGDVDPSLSPVPAVSTSGLFGMSWTSIALIGVVLLGGAFLLKRIGGGSSGAPVRRRRSFKLPKVSLPAAAMIGALAYFYAKSQSVA